MGTRVYRPVLGGAMFGGQIPVGSAADVEAARQWSARQVRDPWPERITRRRLVQFWRDSRPAHGVASVEKIRRGRNAGRWAVWCRGIEYVTPDHGQAVALAHTLAGCARLDSEANLSPDPPETLSEGDWWKREWGEGS